MLNRAGRRNAHAGKKKHQNHSQPSRLRIAHAVKMKHQNQSQPSRLRTAKYMISAGASPNVTASTNESSSSPNRPPVFVARATRPSNTSAMPPKTTYHPARV